MTSATDVYSHMTIREKWRYCGLAATIGGGYGTTLLVAMTLLTFLLTGILGSVLLAMICASALSVIILHQISRHRRPTIARRMRQFLASTDWACRQGLNAEAIVLRTNRV